ncbi:pappalysin-1-like isoform X2 [Ornithodoros turicata]|uniref:pappalysin-1-like isoform X2 n=1 Tax=Ornithodoros turicata TaxID=34597 RepID=UPI00313864AB
MFIKTLCVAVLLGAVRHNTGEKSPFSLRQKMLAQEQRSKALREAWYRCSTSELPVRKAHLETVRSVSKGESTSKQRREAESRNQAVYIAGTRGTWRSGEFSVPWRHFSVALWLRPEGGQPHPAYVLEAEDLCTPLSEKSWAVLIEGKGSPNDQRSGHFAFRFQAAQASTTTILQSPVPYVPEDWHHVAAIYDGATTTLFVNGAQVAVSREQYGSTFRRATGSCRTLSIGGGRHTYYRGLVDNVRLWNITLTQSQIQEDMSRAGSALKPLLDERFDTLDQWDWSGQSPRAVLVPNPSRSEGAQVQIPPCGYTVCDSPDVVRSYEHNWGLRLPKKIRYLVVNMKNSDGSNPTVTEEQVQRQHTALNAAFAPYNITWNLTQVSVMNSSLRHRLITLGCSASKLGDGACDSECQMIQNDAGDCDLTQPECEVESIGDSRCQPECNRALYAWDGGDCCLEGLPAELCLDPSSLQRSYLEVEEYKKYLAFNNSQHINVLFAQWSDKGIIGITTFPWDKSVFTVHGGVVVQPEHFGQPGHLDTLVHEMGHALGLWHVHRGVTEVECHDPCLEAQPSLENGDLCEDTNPTPMNTRCADPPPEVVRCGIGPFDKTPFTNYMGYTDDSCTNAFSPQQVARMHCYADLMYRGWLQGPTPQLPAPPLAPVPISATTETFAISWAPPVAASSRTDPCSYCESDRSLLQYGRRASDGKGQRDTWGADQANGPPDAEPCLPSYNAWLCEDDNCSLTLELEHPVVPSALSVWVTWGSRDGLRQVDLIYADDSLESYKNISSLYCDMPFTLPLFHTKKELTKIRIEPGGSMVAIDAVRVISTANHGACTSCKPIRYRVFREPAFPTGQYKTTDGLKFEDTYIKPGQTYTYRVQAVVSASETGLSPALTYVHGQSYCGDGGLDKGEECDDGNRSPGDGCDVNCKLEPFFRCKGTLCYANDGDGICEPMEDSVRDCGFTTPEGFFDQWASGFVIQEDAMAHVRPPQSLLGPPPSHLACVSTVDVDSAWYACEGLSGSPCYSFTVSFDIPAVATMIHVFIASDASTTAISPTVSVELFHEKNPDVSLPHYYSKHRVACLANPIEIPVVHDLSKPFFFTLSARINVSSSNIGLSAIRLRSSKALNPVAVGKCYGKELYHFGLQKCVNYNCKRPHCERVMLKNAQMVCTGMEEGDTCEVVCDEGYAIGGRRITRTSLTCDSGQWKGHGALCKPVDCMIPVIAHADPMCPEGTTYGKTCSFKCRPPARWKGGVGGFANITCGKKGRWSEPSQECHVACPPPDTPPDAAAVSSNCRNTESFMVGHKCRFHCKRGFHVVGNSHKNWKGPSCAPVTCPTLPTLYNGLFTCTNSWKADSVCSIACPGGSNVDLKCGQDGAWDKLFPYCSFKNLHCPLPKDTTAELVYWCNDTYVGSTCSVTCTSTKQEPVFDGHRLRHPVTCSGSGFWHPDPKSIQCKEVCTTDFIGDTWCDANNNQEHCGWDGGDCCSSTVKGRVVRTFPPNCGDECACKDPEAR